MSGRGEIEGCIWMGREREDDRSESGGGVKRRNEGEMERNTEREMQIGECGGGEREKVFIFFYFIRITCVNCKIRKSDLWRGKIRVSKCA